MAIGNSRLHWAKLIDKQIQQTWDTPHWSAAQVQQWIDHPVDCEQQPVWDSDRASIPIWIASVVPAQSRLWQAYPQVRFISLEQVPLKGLYSTLGLDRALAVWGAICRVGSPVLVIDAGTALTFTGADSQHQLIGGAILPGLRLQLQSLGQGTAALPFVEVTDSLPPRWALNTPEAIASGITYTLVAGMQSYITAWWQQFPDSAVVLTGGDRDRLGHCLKQHWELADRIVVAPDLIFQGMQAVRAGVCDDYHFG